MCGVIGDGDGDGYGNGNGRARAAARSAFRAAMSCPYACEGRGRPALAERPAGREGYGFTIETSPTYSPPKLRYQLTIRRLPCWSTIFENAPPKPG